MLAELQRFLFNTLTELSRKITSFDQKEKVEVEARLSWARRIGELTLHHPHAPHTWEDARDAIAAAHGVRASALYRERPIDLKPQMGLVPIGMPAERRSRPTCPSSASSSPTCPA